MNLPNAATIVTGYDRSPLIDGSDVLRWIRDVNTLDPASPIEIRGSGQKGQASVGVAGSFNVPSLLDSTATLRLTISPGWLGSLASST